MTSENNNDPNKITLNEFIDRLYEPGEDGKSIADCLEESKQAFVNQADSYWDELSYDDKLKAFYSVCKRIHKGDLIDRGSYRYVLYHVFGFSFDAYSIGMDCGYLDIHNSIYTPDDINIIKKGADHGTVKHDD